LLLVAGAIPWLELLFPVWVLAVSVDMLLVAPARSEAEQPMP
jgi:hypothetical protein